MPQSPIAVLKSHKGLAGWIAVSNRTIRRELYFMPNRVESDRFCEIYDGTVTVYRDRDGQRGQASFAITASGEGTFAADLDRAYYMAGLGGEPTWAVAGPGSYTKVVLLDPEARDDEEFLGNRARSAITSALAEVPGVRLAGGEFFLSKTRSAVVTSAGAAAENDMSLYNVELVFLAGSGSREEERQVSIRRRRYQDLALPDLVRTEARRALDRLEAVRPDSGPIPVILSPGAFGGFVDYLVGATSGRAVHTGETPLKVGQPIAPNAVLKGEPLVLDVNALFPFGPASYRIDPTGIAARKVRLIDANVFVTPHTDSQHASYLGLPEATGAPGTPQLPPGKRTEAELRSGDYLEIVQFSDLIPGFETGRFSAEIRFGYQVRGGVRKPVSGGTLSGNIREAFYNASYSKETGLYDDYFGPNAVRIEDGFVITI